MRPINRYLSNKIQPFSIKATDKTIKKIVKDELDRLGHCADLNHIEVSQVTNMDSLFSCCKGDYLGPKYKGLNPDISQWDVSNVKDMNHMFCYCENFNCNIGGWDVFNVIDIDFMFIGCEKFNQDISSWDVSNVESMIHTFNDCSNFNQNLSNWDVTKVEYSFSIFDNCPIREKYKPKFKK